jgi:hypothetical protein
MLSIKAVVGIAAMGLLALAAPAAADTGGWSNPQSTTSGNLTNPSMVEGSASIEYIVARGDTGIWYVTDKSGDYVRTRMTQDFDTHAGGQTYHHQAVHPQIAVNDGGTLTVVYGMQVTPGSCGSQGLVYTQRSGSSWSTPTSIPGTACETATGLVVRGAKIYLATSHGTSRVSYFTNASGPWTRVSVATGPHLGHASLTTYDGKPMLAYIKQGHLIYARGLTSTGQFTHETAATTGAGASSQPSVKINPNNEWQMIVWAQADGTHYAYRNAHGWYSYRVMKGSVSALLAFDTNGHPRIVAADGVGGLWVAQRISGKWSASRIDVHNISELGGIGFGAEMEISYVRGAAHLYWIASSTGC